MRGEHRRAIIWTAELGVRSPWRAQREWSEERRRQYLLDPRIDFPVSIDDAVLPEPGQQDAGDELLLGAGFFAPTTEGDAASIAQVALVVPGPPPDTWTFLGLDVADSTGYSGLTNCGYTEAERAELGATWSPRLNDLHLATDLDAARELANMTNQRVPEHAPFVPVALFRIARASHDGR